MQNITSATGLKNAIQLLEAEQADKGQLLKEQLYITVESLKPVNLLRSTLDDVASSPFLIDNIIRHSLRFNYRFSFKKNIYWSIRR